MVKFCKLNGFGNDYIVIEASELKAAGSLSEFAKNICHRNYGVGSDGIAIIERSDSEEADYSCRIINPDGSEAGFSGNGTRCAVAYLYHKNLWHQPLLRLSTASGLKKYEMLGQDGHTFWYRAELGKPRDLENFNLEILGKTISISALNVGNPVAAIFVDDFDFDWRAIGKEIESHEKFPDRTNVVFIRPIDKENIEIRIWERGAGETSSSGTCSIAAAIAHLQKSDSRGLVLVKAEGGITEAAWRENGEMLIKGRADLICEGEYYGPGI